MSNYDPYEAINKIFGYKKDWANYNQSGDTEKRNQAAKNAQVYYDELRKNNYSSLADELSASGLSESEKINNTYGKKGKTAVRPYLKTIGSKYGLTDADIDNNLKYDTDTGEITFGGMNLGKPVSVISGASYMPEEKLDSFMKSYAEKTGAVSNMENQSKQASYEAQGMNRNLIQTISDDHKTITDLALANTDYAKNHNPYESEIGKSIMDGFRMQGDRSAGNVIAESASTNSGNLDSFAAAEGARQRAAFEQLGKQAVLDDFNARMGHVNDIFDKLGIQHQADYSAIGDAVTRHAALSQQSFDNDQTSKNNEVSRNKVISDISGYIPSEYEIRNNPYFINGRLIDEEKDYQADINDAENALKTEKDPNKIAELNATIRYANQARNFKILNNKEKYGKYAGTMRAVAPLETKDVRMQNADRKSAELISGMTTAAEVQMNADNLEAETQMNSENNATKLTVANIENQGKGKTEKGLTYSQAATALKNGEINDTILKVYNDELNTSYTIKNPPPIYKPAETKKGDSPGWADDSSDVGTTSNTTKNIPKNILENNMWYNNTSSANKTTNQSSGIQATTVSNATVEQWVDKLNATAPMVQRSGVGMYSVNSQYQQIAAKEIFADPSLSSSQKIDLCRKLKISENIISNYK